MAAYHDSYFGYYEEVVKYRHADISVVSFDSLGMVLVWMKHMVLLISFYNIPLSSTVSELVCIAPAVSKGSFSASLLTEFSV